MLIFPHKQRTCKILWIVLTCRARWSSRILNYNQKQIVASPANRWTINRQSHNHSILCSFSLCTPATGQRTSHIFGCSMVLMNEWMNAMNSPLLLSDLHRKWEERPMARDPSSIEHIYSKFSWEKHHISHIVHYKREEKNKNAYPKTLGCRLLHSLKLRHVSR